MREVGHQLEASKHDHQTLEIKTSTPIRAQDEKIQSTYYFFFPKNLDVCRSQQKFYEDARFRSRLVIPITPSAALEVSTGLEAIENEIRKLGGLVTTDEAVESAKIAVNAAADILKKSSEKEIRNLFLSAARFSNEELALSGLERAKEHATELLEGLHGIYRAIDHNQNIPLNVKQLAREYLSYLYTQFIAKLQHESNCGFETERYCSARDRFNNVLCEILRQEARSQAESGIVSAVDDGLMLLRLGKMKKFFQSSSFVDVSQLDPVKRVYEPVAIGGTLFAGVFVASLESLRLVPSFASNIGATFLLSTGVLFYVLRDRMKDVLRSYFSEKVRKALPNHEHALWVSKNRFGKSREWLSLKDSETIPPEIRSLRFENKILEVEDQITEDVLIYRTEELIQPELLPERYRNRGVEFAKNLRFNFQYLFKKLDDPFKEHAVLSQEGTLRIEKSRRLYHVHLIIKTGTLTQSYRIVLNQAGLVSVENVA